MIYKQKVNVPSSHKVVEHHLSPCIKCDCDNIHVDEYEDNFGFISTARCTNCKQEVKVNASLKSVITRWNEENSIVIVIADRERLIKECKKEITALKKKLNKRKLNQ